MQGIRFRAFVLGGISSAFERVGRILIGESRRATIRVWRHLLRWRVRVLGTWEDLPLGADFSAVSRLAALAKAAVSGPFSAPRPVREGRSLTAVSSSRPMCEQPMPPSIRFVIVAALILSRSTTTREVSAWCTSGEARDSRRYLTN